MLHARFDLVLLNHPKAFAVGVHGMGLFFYAVMYARDQETDGFVPRGAIVAAWGDGAASLKVAAKLVRVGLLEEVEGGYRVVNYAAKNETKAQIQKRRDAEARRKATYREGLKSDVVPVGHDTGHPRVSPVTSGSGSGSDSDSDLSSGSEIAREAPPDPPRVDDPGGFLPGAWLMGLSAAVPGPKTRLAPHDVRSLIALAEAHSGGLRGQALLAWVEATATEFARAADPRFGLTVRRCAAWLDARKPTDPARSSERVDADGLVRPVAPNGRPLQGYDPKWLEERPASIAKGSPRFDESTPIPPLRRIR